MDWIFYCLQSHDFFLKNEAPNQLFITDKNKLVAAKEVFVSFYNSKQVKLIS